MKLFDIQQTPGTDQCAVEAGDIYNKDIFTYSVDNMHGVPREKLVDFSSGHTNLRFGDGYVSPDGIDVDSRFRNGQEWFPRGKQQLATRIYHAVPNMSRGKVQDDTQKIGDMTHDRMTALSGVTIDRFEPLLPDVEKTMQAPEHIVPPWVRGGEDTRQSSRTVAYVSAQGYRRETPSSPWSLGAQ